MKAKGGVGYLVYSIFGQIDQKVLETLDRDQKDVSLLKRKIKELFRLFNYQSGFKLIGSSFSSARDPV